MRAVPVQTETALNGLTISWWTWPGETPAVILSHATGFHARCWDQVVEHIPNRLCIALDFRGHGQSSKPPLPYHWRSFGEDLAALLDQLSITGATGVGHSMGGHATAFAASLRPEAFAKLLLLDPVIRPRAAYTGAVAELEVVSRRRNSWKSRDEMFDRYKDRDPFRRWVPAVLRDYCNYALLPSGDEEGFVLACPPAVEASIYAHNSEVGANIYEEISGISIPVSVARSAFGEFGGQNFQASPTALDLAAWFPRGQDIELSEVSHFIPMEAPELTAKMITEC